VLPDGKKTTAVRVQMDSDWDVALLKADVRRLDPLTLTDPDSVGEWTFSPDAAGGVSAIGMVSVTDLPVRGRGIISRPTSKAYLGIALNPVPPSVLEGLGLKSGVVVDVEPGFPAAKAGLKTGDVLFEAEGKPVADPDSFMDFMLNKKPGDTLDLRVAREDAKLNLTVNLSERPANLPGRGGLLAQLSGEISRMHGPFPRVLQHDTVLRPNIMGGPLLDIEGRCIGVNIARADRTSTYAISAKDVKEIYAKLKAK
jgi:serine protease Do